MRGEEFDVRAKSEGLDRLKLGARVEDERLRLEFRIGMGVGDRMGMSVRG